VLIDARLCSSVAEGLSAKDGFLATLAGSEEILPRRGSPTPAVSYLCRFSRTLLLSCFDFSRPFLETHASACRQETRTPLFLLAFLGLMTDVSVWRV
jgi:hypothetical protein